MKWIPKRSSIEWPWIKKVWEHHREAKTNERKVATDFWDCCKVTLALLLSREKPEILDFDWYYEHGYDPESYTLAWDNFGEYWCDYGTGTSWDYLVLGPWLTYAIGNDGSL